MDTSSIRWGDLVSDLASHTSAANLARRLGADPREIKRWKDGKTRPRGENADKLMQECEQRGINWRKYRRTASIYDLRIPFDENVAEGPQSLSSHHDPYIPDVPTTFLGRSLNSPLGIPACVLTIDSQWIGPLSRYGYDLFTAKTVRTRRTRVHPFPNWFYLPDLNEPIKIGEFPESIRSTSQSPGSGSHHSSANSFGMPSDDPEKWQPELIKSKEALRHGQMFIASVVGTADEPTDDLVADFIKCARLASEAVPHAIELNFSCPNVYGHEGSLCLNTAAAAQICEQVSREIKGTPLLVKIGYLQPAELDAFFKAVYRYVHGFTAINTIPARIVSCAQREEPAFSGSVRVKAGVSGIAIREHAQEIVRGLHMLAAAHRPDLEIIGVGGIGSVDDVRRRLDAGARVVQMCTAVNSNPFLAQEIRQELAAKPTGATTKAFGHSVACGDATVLTALQTTAQVCSSLNVPIEIGIKALNDNWLNGYLGDLKSLQGRSASGFRTRREAPRQDQITEWIKKEQHAKHPKVDVDRTCR